MNQRYSLYISDQIKKDSLAEYFVSCLKSIPDDIGVYYHYICLLTTRGFMNVRVDAVYPDGYMSEGVFYTFSPFTAVSKDNYQSLIELEQRIAKEQEKGKLNEESK